MRIQVHRYARVDHRDVGASVSCQGVDGCSAAQEIEHHLRSHLGGVGRNALGGYPVVAGNHDYRFACDLRDRLAEYSSQLDGQRFKAAETPGRLGEHTLPGLGGSDGVGVQRADGGSGLVNQ